MQGGDATFIFSRVPFLGWLKGKHTNTHHFMVVVRKHFTFLLVVVSWLNSNQTAKVLFLAPQTQGQPRFGASMYLKSLSGRDPCFGAPGREVDGSKAGGGFQKSHGRQPFDPFSVLTLKGWFLLVADQRDIEPGKVS